MLHPWFKHNRVVHPPFPGRLLSDGAGNEPMMMMRRKLSSRNVLPDQPFR